MFREVARKKQALTSEQIIKILKTEKRGVLSVQGSVDYSYVCKDCGCMFDVSLKEIIKDI